MPCHVRLSSPVIPGPVFCCADAETEAVMAPIKDSAHHPSLQPLERMEDGWIPRTGQLRAAKRNPLV